ncbi:TRAM domain-containing protein [Salinicola tamaricis]|uniref:TRAM domain-containing protein n=1 Tax=Salinicola tamaricis TaxID=1771309 RepID=UPI000D0A537D|nr:TRAM domain-containing protein [Salinicola tamaricis]
MAMLGKRRTPARKRESTTAPSGDTAAPGLYIERLAHDGRGVARAASGKTVFVSGALPGERVEVAVHRERRRFDEAHVRQRLVSAPERVTPPCAYFDRCGGCDLQHMDIAAQREHKRRVVSELLIRQGIEPPSEVGLIAGADVGYRRRARLGVKRDGEGRVHLGFRARGSDQLVDIVGCMVLTPALAALLAPLRELLATLAVPRHVGHLELLLDDHAVPVVVVRQLREVSEDSERWRCFGERHGVAVAQLQGREQPQLHWLGAAPTLAVRVQGAAHAVTLALAPGDFVQVNAEINQRLIDTARAWLTPTPRMRLLDLFAGIGNFSLALAGEVAAVTAVEGSQTMVERLRANADANALPAVTAVQADLSAADAGLEALLADHDTLILDPPRDGADALCRRVAQSEVAQVLYVSCDPASLARDAAHLVAGGLVLRRLAVADMFPHTAHLESLALFTRPGVAVGGGGADHD